MNSAARSVENSVANSVANSAAGSAAATREPEAASEDIAKLFGRIITGVYVIGVTQGDRRDAFTASSLIQISYSPLLILLGVNPNHRPYSLLGDGSAFAVSVLKEDQLATARHFGPHANGHADKLSRYVWRTGVTGAPILEDAIAYFECVTTGDMPAGDHRIILGKVVAGGVLDADGATMLYSQTDNMDGSRALYPTSFETVPSSPDLFSRAPAPAR